MYKRQEPDHSILLTLEKTMEYFDGDRAYIFEMDDEKQVSQNTYEFCAPGIPPEKDNLQNLPYAIQEYALEIFKNKGHVCLKDIESIRKSGIDKKQIITSQGIYSLILVPLWMGETLIGYMGVDNPKRNVSHADHLLALGDYIAAILLRRDNEAQILSDNRIMHELMNDMPGGFVQMKMYPDGRVEPMFINEEFCRMSGMNHEQCVEYYGHDAFTGLHPDDQAVSYTHLKYKLLVCILPLFGILSGCAKQQGENRILYQAQEPTAPETELTFFGFKYEALNVKAIENALHGFMDEYPDINISYDGIKSPTYFDVLEKRLDTGNGDDIIMVDHARALELEKQNRLADLSDLSTLDQFSDLAKSQMAAAGEICYCLLYTSGRNPQYVPFGIGIYRIYGRNDRDNIKLHPVRCDQ